MVEIIGQGIADEEAVRPEKRGIEQIVAWLLHVGALGGFHFNDWKYADNDLTLGSINPYQLFRIFHEISAAAPSSGLR